MLLRITTALVLTFGNRSGASAQQHEVKLSGHVLNQHLLGGTLDSSSTAGVNILYTIFSHIED